MFGSRFMPRSEGRGLSRRHKLLLNRLANTFIRLLFGLRLNDVTNAFKCYRREVIAGCSPLLSKHFNLTVELPLKAIVRGYSYTVLPINWYNRTTGVSKLKIKEMGSRYLFIVLYVWLEKAAVARRLPAAGEPCPQPEGRRLSPGLIATLRHSVLRP